jgi:hypothetical protein
MIAVRAANKMAIAVAKTVLGKAATVPLYTNPNKRGCGVHMLVDD